jgi:hypothetical protein
MQIITVPSAEKEIKRLQHFLEVVESYEADTLEKWIIKEYAFTGSIRDVLLSANARGLTRDGIELDKGFVSGVIAGYPKDELHRTVKANYRLRTKRHSKKY